jgi:hypothetical protein
VGVVEVAAAQHGDFGVSVISCELGEFTTAHHVWSKDKARNGLRRMRFRNYQLGFSDLGSSE